MKKFVTALFLITASFGAQAEHGHVADISATATTFVGTIITFEATSGGSLDCHYHGRHRHCHDVYKVAAIEAAEYVAGGERGPMLNAFASVYPEADEDQILDAIFKAAEGL